MRKENDFNTQYETGEPEMSEKQEPKLESETEDFRIYEKEIIYELDGRIVVMHKCEELVGGRWESFYAMDLIVEADGSAKYCRLGQEPLLKIARDLQAGSNN